MHFLITGITGFAGPHLALQLLRDGHTVTGLIRHSNGRETDLLDVIPQQQLDSIKLKFADLADNAAVDRALAEDKYDGVFHLAAQSHPPTSFKYPQATYLVNVMGTVNLVEAVRKYQSPECLFHFCSTSEVYGDQGKDVGVLTEEVSLKPCNPYGASKAAMDLYVQERIANGMLKGFVTRAFSHTGPRRGKNFSISSDAYQIAQMMVNESASRVLRIGNLQTERVVMDVNDCVRAYKLLMYCKSSGVYNVCGTEVHKMQRFTDILIQHSKLLNITQQIYQPFYRPIDIAVQIGDSTRIHQETGWQANTPIEETLSDLLDYWVEKL